MEDKIKLLIEKWNKDYEVKMNVLKPDSALFYTSSQIANARGAVPCIASLLADLNSLLTPTKPV